MKPIGFRKFMEFADYGFDRKVGAAFRGGTRVVEDDGPVNPIASQMIMHELRRLPPLGPNMPRQTWKGVMEWGTGVGALKIEVSPLGSYKVIARRQIKDLKGETAWICKSVFPLVENEHNENEVSLAHEIYEHLQKTAEGGVEGPQRSYPGFERLADSLADATARDHPSYCMFPVGVRRLNEDYFKIVFEFRGHGVESPTRGRAEQFNIDLLWDRERGLTRCWGYNIDSTVGQHSWRVQPSEWDEHFSPGQPIDEIVEAVIKIFSTY